MFTISLHQQDHTAFFPLDNWEWNISLNNSLPLRPPLPSPLERILFKSGKIKLRKFSPLHPQIEREQNCKVINMDCLSGRGYVNVVECHAVRSSRRVCVCCGVSFHIHCCRCSPGYTAQRWQSWLWVISFRPSWGWSLWRASRPPGPCPLPSPEAAAPPGGPPGHRAAPPLPTSHSGSASPAPALSPTSGGLSESRG